MYALAHGPLFYLEQQDILMVVATFGWHMFLSHLQVAIPGNLKKGLNEAPWITKVLFRWGIYPNSFEKLIGGHWLLILKWFLSMQINIVLLFRDRSILFICVGAAPLK